MSNCSPKTIVLHSCEELYVEKADDDKYIVKLIDKGIEISLTENQFEHLALVFYEAKGFLDLEDYTPDFTYDDTEDNVAPKEIGH